MSLLEQIILCKNYQQITQKPHHQNTQYLWTHLLRLQCIYKELTKNRVTTTLTSDLNIVTNTISAFAPQWYQGLYSRVKTLLLSVYRQDASHQHLLQSLASQVLLKDSVRDKTLSTRLGLIHNLSDAQPWTAVKSSSMYDAWHLHAKGRYFDEVTEAFCKNMATVN